MAMVLTEVKPMRALPLLAAALLAGGCVAHHRYAALAPAQALAGDPFAAQAEAEGVRVVARAGDWRGWPETLEERLTPVGVMVENRSGKALRIRPESFELVDPGGFRYRALGTADLQREFSYLGGWRWHGWYGPWLGFWDWPGWPAYEPYPGTWGAWWYVEPTPPPQRAEGTLQDEGRLRAWLFFPVPTGALPHFELVVELVDEATGRGFGAVRISFLREGEQSLPSGPALPAPEKTVPPEQAPPPQANPG